MKAVWTVGGILGDKVASVDFVADLGFDTIVMGNASPEMRAVAQKRSVQIVTTIFPFADDGFKRNYSHALQKVRDYEYQIGGILAEQPWEQLTAGSYQWHPVSLTRSGMCFGHEETKVAIRARIDKALSWADGIALDGFGFMNYYACFCDRCEGIRAEMKTAEPDKPDLDILIAPIGGGGLMSGTAIAAKGIKKNIEVIGTEPKMADDAFKSFKSGILVPSVNPQTIADGLLTSQSELTFSIIKKNVDDIVTVDEKSIVEAMRLVWERMKIIIEPSSAVPLAALLEKKIQVKNKKVGIIISGGNVDLSRNYF
ncbi:MAG: pyridoxal-phosphate dependent enzyme [Methylococcales bacterium]|nr:pyridoxal-phosphate dependent enzyme [Methylococcales bacterium]